VIVYVYPADLMGCGYYRLIWPAKQLIAMGHDVRIVHPQSGKKISGGLDGDGRLVAMIAPQDADVLVFQRVTSKTMIEGIKILRQNGIAVVVDIDDDMSAIHQYNPAWAALHPGKTGRKSDEYDWNSALTICDNVTMVTVSTDALLRRYARHGRGRVLHNAVPKIMLDIPPRPQEGVAGWGGSLHSHPDDPQVTGNSMGQIQRAGYKFKIVGPPWGTKQAFSLDQDAITTGPVPIGQWPHELSRLQVGIAPLNDTRFNAAKSWLKMLEYAALGVPCVGSPRAEYRRIHDLGVGLLADNPRQWYRHVRSLLDNETLRAEMIESGRDAVSKLTIENTAWKWWEAWTEALAIERGPLGAKKIKQPA